MASDRQRVASVCLLEAAMDFGEKVEPFHRVFDRRICREGLNCLNDPLLGRLLCQRNPPNSSEDLTREYGRSRFVQVAVQAAQRNA